MKKRVTLYSNPDDPACSNVEKFLSEQDIILNVHDVKTQPLDFNRISKLLRNFDLTGTPRAVKRRRQNPKFRIEKR